MQDSLSSLKSQFPHLTDVEARYDAKARERRQMIDSIMNRQNGIGLRTHGRVPQFITNAAESLDFDAEMIARLIRHESSGNPRAVSYKWASGTMQIMPGTAGDIVTRERNNGEPYFLTYFKKLIPALRSHVADPEIKRIFDILQSPYVTQKDAREAISKISHNFFNPQASIITGMVYLSGRREQLKGRNDLRLKSKETLLSFTPSEHQKIMRSRSAIGASQFGYMDRMPLAERLGDDQTQAEIYELLAQYNGGNKPPRESYGYATVIQFA